MNPKYYILDYNTLTSKHGGNYHLVNLCDDSGIEYVTYAFENMRNYHKWAQVLQTHENTFHGVELEGFKVKKNAKPLHGKLAGAQLIDADSIAAAEVTNIFETKEEMYSHVWELLQDLAMDEEDNHSNTLWEFNND